MSRRLPRLQNEMGQFVRQVEPWTPDKWNEGYIDRKGKFRVYRPDCPCAWRNGYAFRRHVVFWLANGFCHKAGEVIHHGDENKLNDNIDNLELKTRGQHTRDHCLQQGIKFTCRQCSEDFYVKQFRIDQRRREEGREIKYCSQRCYHLAPKSRKKVA